MASPRSHRSTSCDLYIQCRSIAQDPASTKYYGEYAPCSTAYWTVNCRNRRDPHRTVLPVSFATLNDAQRAMKALVHHGLCTDDALHRRIKIELNWESVKRIMIEALNW